MGVLLVSRDSVMLTVQSTWRVERSLGRTLCDASRTGRVVPTSVLYGALRMKGRRLLRQLCIR
jgi:hypothetical protein